MIKILIVDDDAAVRTKALRCLATLDTELVSAANGQLGLEKARQLKPDVVICDVDMPVMDGFEMLEALRADPELASTLVMMLTGETSRDSMRLGMKLGADDYLTKPFTDEELLDALEGLLVKRGRLAAVVSTAVRDQEDYLRRQFGRSFDGGVSSDKFALESRVMTPSQQLVNAAVLFSDIRNFTAISEKLTAPEVAELLTEYFERVCEPALVHGGHYLKMMGDGLMAVFTEDPEFPMPPARRALLAAVSMADIVRQYADSVLRTYAGRALPAFQAGFGVHYGEIAISQMGSTSDKVETPIGDTVNVAARLEAASKGLGWAIVCSVAALEHAGAGVETAATASLSVRGKELPIAVVQVTGLHVDPQEYLAQGAYARTLALPGSEKTLPLARRPDDRGNARAELLEQARRNASVAGRAVKGALAAKLESIKEHTFEPDSEIHLAGYRILRRIGSGGMSSIYLATREADGDLLVLKIIDASEGADDQLPRFVREYTLLASIQHPNIIRIFNQGFSDKHAYIAMEFFENGDLRSRMRQPLSAHDALAITAQTAHALTAIHALGIVHRDLKPENLMVRADGSVALADFGIAKLLTSSVASDSTLTQEGDLLGSPSYMSPEQISGREVTPQSDLYSLGVMLFELLTGKRPYQGETLASILSLHVKSPPPTLPGSLSHYQPLIDQLMAKDAASRYETAGACLADLHGRFGVREEGP